MNADEAQRRGLVTKLFWPEKFDAEFRTLLSHISNLSKPVSYFCLKIEINLSFPLRVHCFLELDNFS